jgi:WD40 repeat protein
LIRIETPQGMKTFRRLKEDDVIQAGDLLAQLDDRLARDEWAIRGGKVISSKADLAATEKTRDEAKSRHETQLRLLNDRATSKEEARATQLTWDRYHFEAISKREGVGLAELEHNQAKTILAMHQIRSSIPGVIKTIYKKRGEAVRNLEPVFQIHDLSRLRVEGLVEIEYLHRLRKGMRVVLEPSRADAPEQTLLGHLQEITSVAVGVQQKLPIIVSASEDGSVRIWDRGSRHEKRVWWHPCPVRAVACGPASKSESCCLTGAADGSVRLWDLNKSADEPVQVFAEQHHGAVTCVAFSPDGKHCVSGGDDRDICLWDTATGQLCYRFPAGHRAAVTALQFTPQSNLVSAGRDNTLRVWKLGKEGASLHSTIDRRSGDVAMPGVSPDGKRVLLDQGKSLRLLTLQDRFTENVLENKGEAIPFTTFALFSPDARMILTAGAAEGRVQLWRAPTANTRPYELRQLVSRDRAPATCAAFAPDNSFVVAGTKDRQVLVWPLPTTEEIERQWLAELTLVERSVDSSSRQVRIWAEVANSKGQLLPGTSVTIAIYPQ